MEVGKSSGALLLEGVISRLLVIILIQFLLDVVQRHLGSQDLTLTSRAGTVVVCHPVCLTLSLCENGSKILVLSEHWLWPYEMHKLHE